MRPVPTKEEIEIRGKLELCLNCAGNGYFAGGSIRCPWCNGDGWLDWVDKIFHPNTAEEVWKEIKEGR